MTEIIGKLHIHSETGTEGGYWAIQDREYITLPSKMPTTRTCSTCHRIWAFSKGLAEPAPIFTYSRHALGLEGYYYSNEPVEDGRTRLLGEEPGSFNEQWINTRNERSMICYQDGHTWVDDTPQETWQYEGLVFLESGDRLEILDENDEVLESINVELIQQSDQYASDARHARGMVIHSYPTESTLDYDEWCDLFFKEVKARLIRV